MMSEFGFQQYVVAAEQGKPALIGALRRWQPGESWSQWRRLIRNRHVEINGGLCTDEGQRLGAGDVIRVWKEPRRPPEPRAEVAIRFVDPHMVVVEKPAGVATVRQPEERHWPRWRRELQPALDEMVARTLARQAASRGPKSRGGRTGPVSLRVVHRLDADTSGLLVFARSREAEEGLVQMFRKHDLERAYLAIVNGRVREQTFDSYLVEDRGDGLRGGARRPGLGKRAVTHVRPLEYLDGYTLLQCRLETGRTHQIRIHLAEAGHMVCGEKLYGRRPDGPRTEDPSGAERQALHAARLALRHPVTGESLEFDSPLPPDMARLLIRLRGRER